MKSVGFWSEKLKGFRSVIMTRKNNNTCIKEINVSCNKNKNATNCNISRCSVVMNLIYIDLSDYCRNPQMTRVKWSLHFTLVNVPCVFYQMF